MTIHHHDHETRPVEHTTIHEVRERDVSGGPGVMLLGILLALALIVAFVFAFNVWGPIGRSGGSNTDINIRGEITLPSDQSGGGRVVPDIQPPAGGNTAPGGAQQPPTGGAAAP